MQLLDTDADIAAQFRSATVVAVDDSPPAAAALRFAATLCRRTDVTLHVLMIWNVLIGSWLRIPGDRPPTEAERQAEAARVLADFVKVTLDDGDHPPMLLHAIHGNVQPLLREISAEAAHMIVGSRGRGGVADLLLGSTSADLVDHARCPVTVVPTVEEG